MMFPSCSRDLCLHSLEVMMNATIGRLAYLQLCVPYGRERSEIQIIPNRWFPTWFPTWSQNSPKSIQEPSEPHPNLHLIFDRLLDRFLINFWSIFCPILLINSPVDLIAFEAAFSVDLNTDLAVFSMKLFALSNLVLFFLLGRRSYLCSSKS